MDDVWVWIRIIRVLIKKTVEFLRKIDRKHSICSNSKINCYSMQWKLNILHFEVLNIVKLIQKKK